jgi:hypothetical protein
MSTKTTAENEVKPIQIRSLESLGMYEGNESPFFGKPFMKISVTTKIPGDVGSKFPKLSFVSDYVMMAQDGKTIEKHVTNTIALFDAEMYKHAHQKVGDRVMFVYTFVYGALALESQTL